MEFSPLIKWCLVALYVFGVIVSPIIWGFFYGREVKSWDGILRALLYFFWPPVLVLFIVLVGAVIVLGVPAAILGITANSLNDLGAILRDAWENRKKGKK